MTTPEDRVVWEADEEALYRSAHEAGHLPPGGVSDTFVRPCLVCGITVHVVDGRERDHLHHVFEADESLAAFAWWQGHDSADAELEQARAENERLRVERDAADAAAGRRMDQSIKWMERAEDFEGRYEVAHDARMVAESALTEAREQLSRLREAVEGLADRLMANGCDYRHQQGQTDQCNGCTAADFAAVLADVTPAVQGDTGDTPPAEQEAGEGFCTCDGPERDPLLAASCGLRAHYEPARAWLDSPAPSGSDDTKGGKWTPSPYVEFESHEAMIQHGGIQHVRDLRDAGRRAIEAATGARAHRVRIQCHGRVHNNITFSVVAL